MDDFDIAYEETKKMEGGWNHVEGDAGGETYLGIARNFWPNLKMWLIVDKHKPLAHNQIIKSAELDSLVKQFYKTQFWDKISPENLPNLAIRKKVYDMAVNMGIRPAIEILQESYGVAVTGKVTPELISVMNKTDYI